MVNPGSSDSTMHAVSKILKSLFLMFSYPPVFFVRLNIQTAHTLFCALIKNAVHFCLISAYAFLRGMLGENAKIPIFAVPALSS